MNESPKEQPSVEGQAPSNAGSFLDLPKYPGSPSDKPLPKRYVVVDLSAGVIVGSAIGGLIGVCVRDLEAGAYGCLIGGLAGLALGWLEAQASGASEEISIPRLVAAMGRILYVVVIGFFLGIIGSIAGILIIPGERRDDERRDR